MMPDTKQLRHLCTVVEQGTFMRAASTLNISQPALSKSIRLLEHTMGVKLLDRGRHGAVPTPYGKALALRYKRIEAELREANYDIDALKVLGHGNLTIGATKTATSYIVPTAVSALKAHKPNIAIQLIEDRATNLVDALNDGQLDIVVGPIYGESVSSDLAEEFLFNSRLLVITRPGHPLARRKKVTLSELTPYLYVGVGVDNTLSRQIQSLLKRAELPHFRYAVQTNSPQATKDIVRQSDYFGLLPESHVQADLKGKLLHVIELKAAGNSWPFGVRWRRDRSVSPAMNAFFPELKRASRLLAKRH
jgi:DNA-binding transcriptional LysR family regulator